MNVSDEDGLLPIDKKTGIDITGVFVNQILNVVWRKIAFLVPKPFFGAKSAFSRMVCDCDLPSIYIDFNDRTELVLPGWI